MKHDFEDQRRETFDTFDELRKQGEALPARSILEVYLLAEGGEANWGGAEKSLLAKGFATERDEDGDTLIVATKTAIAITPDAIWQIEKEITGIGLKFDFVPDGWEFGFD